MEEEPADEIGPHILEIHSRIVEERLADYRRGTSQVRSAFDIFDELASDLPVPESHIQLAEERLDAYLRDPSRARDAFEAVEEIAQSAHAPGQRTEAAWAEEIDRRHGELERGEVKPLSGPETIARLKEEFS